MKLYRILLIGLAFCHLATAAHANRLYFDFESGDLQGWQVVEGSFGNLISDRSIEHHSNQPYTKQGNWFLSTLESHDGKSPDDKFTGKVESPLIRLSDPEITLLVGGGSGNNVYIALCDEQGNEIAKVRGNNSQTMQLRTIDATKLVDKLAFFRVVDRSTGGWGHVTLDNLTCKGAIDSEATARRFTQLREKQRQAAQAARVAHLTQLKLAVSELGTLFKHYPATQLLQEIQNLEHDDNPEALGTLALNALVKQNPLLNTAPILFVTRKQYRPDHHNTATLFVTGEINERSYDTEGCFKVLDVRSGKTTALFEPGPGATVRDPDLSFDGKKLLFSMRRSHGDNYHIYSMDIDGTNLRQLTGAPNVADIDPIWLPDGDIVFASTREPKYCMCNRHIMCNLYRMQSDGANIHQIGKSTLFEGHPTLLPDGRILYDRWEYVDRNFGDAQGLWVCNPDGTGHAIYWGNNTTSPGGIIDAQPLSRSDHVIAVLASCHDRPWGALGLIDRSLGIDGATPVLHTWPNSFTNHIKTVGQDFDSTIGIKLKYEDPFPLSDRHFICTRQTGKGEETGLYYLDMHGNELLIYAEPPGCYDPLPLRPRKAPPIIPSRRNFEHPNAPGYFYLQNVYIGTHMQGVKPGSIKYLRVIESPEKRSWSQGGWGGQGEQAPAMNWHNFENKRILGTVPVESDGSAYFEVPGNTFVFFQALDENKMMVQSMRSGTYVQPGEAYGCVGCHEDRVGNVPAATQRPLAMRRKPDKLDGWFGTARMFSFQREVQPVLDRNCQKCHDYGSEAADKLNLSGDRDLFFATSYVDIWAKKMVECIGGGPAEIQQPYTWGSHPSKLIQVLRAGHADLELSHEDFERLTTWVDLNAPYYPYYESAYPQNPGGRSPLTSTEINEIVKLSGIKIHGAHGVRQLAQVNFERPALSRILQKLDQNSEAYQKIVTIIENGTARLKKLQRADMDGFAPCSRDQERDNFYQTRLLQEVKVYDAIRSNNKIYDPLIN